MHVACFTSLIKLGLNIFILSVIIIDSSFTLDVTKGDTLDGIVETNISNP